ncbi:MAG: aminotransferase class I/II-fold pyridoxal phosphate-dependent enzyme [Planctomyces sp.]|nr:aminotransferase class I/II-fold pyridoxal phosphate-dependent enzyme [Planctomyces sp.]
MENSPISDLVSFVYSPATFEKMSLLWRELLSRHYSGVVSGVGPVLNWNDPSTLIQRAEAFLDHRNTARGDVSEPELLERFSLLVRTMLSSGQNLHHPHYIGHQVPASSPVAGLFDAVGTITNQVMAIFEMGPWATAVEYALVNRLAAKIGWDPQQSCGLLTHGGSLANLTALLTARNVRLPGSWEDGVPSNAVLLTHTDSHYCVSRTAGILGLGTKQIARIPVDARRKMRPDRLEEELQRLQREGRPVMALSCCACATPTGAFDPLEEIAEICERYQVWMHVDAAHGGAALMSRRHRSLLRGIERADSVVWDAHKMLFVPALCAAVLYRQRDVRFETFRQNAPYLFDPSAPGLAEYDSGMRTIECTKRATGFGLWGLWAIAGEEVFEQLVDRMFYMARTLYELIVDAEDFEPLHEPECNILVFQYRPARLNSAPADLVNRFQREVRSRLIRSGHFYVVQTQLGDHAGLRVTMMNPATTETDLSELLNELRRIGREVLDGASWC